MIIDTHKYNFNRKKILENMPNVEFIIDLGTNMKSNKKSIKLANENPKIFSMIGFFPTDTIFLNEEIFSQYIKMLDSSRIVGIGEIGLDYYWEKDKNKRNVQKYWFAKQLNLAKEMNLPVSMHSRNLEKDFLDLLKDISDKKSKGVIHCYSHSIDTAKEILNLGYYFGIGGTSTYKNAKEIRDVISILPTDKILLETDAPYLSPEPYRGKLNNSEYLIGLPKILQKLKTLQLKM